MQWQKRITTTSATLFKQRALAHIVIAHKMCVVRRGARCRWRRQRQRNVKEEKNTNICRSLLVPLLIIHTHTHFAGWNTVLCSLHATRRISNTFRGSRIYTLCCARLLGVRHRGRFIIRSNRKDLLKYICSSRGDRHIVI